MARVKLAPDADVRSEAHTATSKDERPARSTAGSTYRTAVCGPACTVVWEGRGREASPYPD